MVLTLMLIGLAVALDPLPLTAFLVILPSTRGVRKGAAFVFGWLVSLAIVVTVTVLANRQQPAQASHGPVAGTAGRRAEAGRRRARAHGRPRPQPAGWRVAPARPDYLRR